MSPTTALRERERLTKSEAAHYLSMTYGNLDRLRRLGRGPNSYLISGRRYYDRAELDRWVAAQQAAAK